MGALEDAREASAMPLGPRRGATTRVHVIAQLLSLDEPTQRATVSIDGSGPITLPYAPGVYEGYTTVLCLCDPLAGGRAVYVLAPVGAQDEAPPPPPGPPPSTAAALVLPTWSGTWRQTRWGNWNIGRYGGASDLYQGSAYGSGPMVGLATYGEQLVGLGATAITAAVLTVQRNGSGGDATVTVQGSPHPTPPGGAPSASGDTATSPVLGAAAGTTMALPASVCEAMRTGAVKGLCTVGAAYAGVFGTSRADGMALSITYTRPA